MRDRSWRDKSLRRTILLITGLCGLHAFMLGNAQTVPSPAANVEQTALLRQFRPMNASSSLERTIQGEMKTLNGLSSMMEWPKMTPVAVWYCDGCGMNSQPGVGIVVDVKQLKTIQENSGLSDKRMRAVISFLLAHEYVHQVQYNVYTPAILGYPVSEKRVYEAQADLLASLFVLQTAIIFDNEKTRNVLKLLDLGDGLPHNNIPELYSDWVNVAFTQGAERFSLSDHPSRAARASAARLALGALYGFSLLQKKDRPKVWNVHEGEKQLDWSLRTARLLCNDDQDAVVNLIQKNADINWGDNKDQNVRYRLTYKNEGDKPLNVSLVIECVESLRGADAEDIAKWKTSEMKEHTFVLAPNASQIVEGQLHWTRSSVSTMPKLNLPGYVGGIVSASYNTKPLSESNEARSKSLAYFSPQDESFIFTFQTLLGSSRKWLALRSGPGMQQEDGIVYPSDPQLSGSLTTLVYKLDAYNYASRVMASFDGKQYESVLGQVRKILDDQGGWVQSRLPGEEEAVDGVRFSKRSINVDVVKMAAGNMMLIIELDI